MLVISLTSRVNIEIFGSLLRNAVLSKKCWYIIDLLNQAVQMDLTLDEKALKMLDQFKNDTMEQLAKFVRHSKHLNDLHSDFFFQCSYCHFRIVAKNAILFMGIRNSDKRSRSFA